MPKGKALSDAERAKRDAAKAAKFKELGSKRLNNALTAIRRLQPLSNRAQYAYTDEQVATINRHLTDAVKNVIDGFAPGAKADTAGVTL